jgi:hypothetical protein
MTDPYAPPETQEALPHPGSVADRVLRWTGAICFTYLAANELVREDPDAFVKWNVLAVMAAMIYGFLRGGKKSHLGIAIFMAISIPTQAFFMSRAIANPERLGIVLSPDPWLEFAVAVIPHAIALICASALYVRARRGASP